MALLLTLEIVALLFTMSESSNPSPPTYHLPHERSKPNSRLRPQPGAKSVNIFDAYHGDFNDNSHHRDSDDADAPKLDELTKRLRIALEPYQMSYLRQQARKAGENPPPCVKTWSSTKKGYLPNCPSNGCVVYAEMDAAKAACEKIDDCGGITSIRDGSYEVRQGDTPEISEGESSWVLKDACKKRARAANVWEEFSSTLREALLDSSLNLDKSYGPPRKDDSIYLSVASYRDNTCPLTLRQAFERADHPSLLFVGIVQQNCLRDCMTGTGWGKTRAWVPGPPDTDCVNEFCSDPETKHYCDNSQVRILRLEEIQSYGPFFSRFLNSKLWRGETYYMQIDAHTEFRRGWDTSLVDQMKRTPSFPYSVISNYPPSGGPSIKRDWPASSSSERFPGALCGCRFEGAGGRHKTVRLLETGRRPGPNIDKRVPQRSAFVAAGFFIAHGSIVDNVPFDPFMPYLFMGEEIALSIRFWTSGYDIYGPAVDVLRHEYVRKESPKFWESVTMIFSNGMIHNRLTDLIIPRVQILLGFDEGAGDPSRIKPQSILTMADRYSVGTKRSVEDFVETMGFDLEKMIQRMPEWCEKPGISAA